MRYAQIRTMDISNGAGIGVSIFTQGCRFHCKNCFNSELWTFEGGKEWGEEQTKYLYSLLQQPFVKRFSILGGEPLEPENLDTLTFLTKQIKEDFPNIIIWLYTGNTFEKLNDKQKEVVKNVDVLVDGLFIDALKDPKLLFRGSSNQRIIDVQKSLSCDKIILYME